MVDLMKKSFCIKKDRSRKDRPVDELIKPHQLIEKKSSRIRSLCLLTALILLFCSGCASQERSVQSSEESIQPAAEHSAEKAGESEYMISSTQKAKPSHSEEKNLAIFDDDPKGNQFGESAINGQITPGSFDGEFSKRKGAVLQGNMKAEPPRTAGIEKNNRRAAPVTSSAPVKVELAFDNADLFEVLDATLFELFKVNYIIDPHVKAKVSFHFSGTYTKQQFIALLNDILQLSNLSITQGPGDMFKIVSKNESAGLTAQDVYEGGLPDGSGDISRLIRLRYLDAPSVLKSVQTFTSKGAPISVDTVSNSIIVTDTLENVEKVINVLALMDVPYFMDISWRIFPVKQVESKDIVQNITKLIKSSGLYYRPGAVKGGYEVLSIDSINAILVATRWPEILDLVDKWISAMDYLGDDAGNGTGVFVYFMKNGTAVEMADILKQLYGAKASGSSSQKTQIVKPTEKSDQSKSKDNAATNLKTSSVSGDLSGDVEIIPDEINNAIIFKASQRDYKIIKNVLKELDINPRQVLINVVIAEVSLTNETQYGVQWLLNNSLGNYQGQGGLDTEDSSRTFDQTLGTVSNFSYGIYNSSNILKGLVTALGSDSKVTILSSPNIMAVDNKEAMIEVGEDVPTISGTVQYSTDSASVSKSIQYRKTGIILTVTPHVNSSGLVKMELSQEVSERGAYDEVTDNYSILTRKAETSLVVGDQQTILMGGLMRNNTSNSDSGVPFLKDIPILGYLFKSNSKSNTKTELIFLLTPHVVDSKEAADRITREFATKIESIKNLIEKKDN